MSKLQLHGDCASFMCPGCNYPHTVRITGDGAWGYNSSPTSPTFTPSVLVTRVTSEPPVTAENFDQFKAEPWEQKRVTRTCHSFVTDGQIQFLSDCFHEKAGQTVPLNDWTGYA